MIDKYGHRIIVAGRHPWRSLAQPAAQSRAGCKIRPGCSGLLSSQVSKTSKDTDFTTSLGNLLHHLTILMVKKMFLTNSSYTFQKLANVRVKKRLRTLSSEYIGKILFQKLTQIFKFDWF